MFLKRFHITQDKLQFYPGETIKAFIHFNPEKEGYIEDIEITFNLDENWYSSYDSSKKESNKQIITKFNLNLKNKYPVQQNNLIFLKKLEYTFPFEFKLPAYLSPSFEFPSFQYRAFLRYILDAKIKSPSIFGQTSTYVIIQAIPKLDSNNLKVEKSLAIKKWGLFDRGSTILRASYPTKNYKFYDVIPININIDNSKSKLKVKE